MSEEWEIAKAKELCKIIKEIMDSSIKDYQKLNLISQVVELKHKDDFDYKVIFDIAKNLGLEADIKFLTIVDS